MCSILIGLIQFSVLQGDDVLDEHCIIEHHGGNVTLIPMDGAVCTVNGQHIHDPNKLTQGKCYFLYLYFLWWTLGPSLWYFYVCMILLLSILPMQHLKLMFETYCYHFINMSYIRLVWAILQVLMVPGLATSIKYCPGATQPKCGVACSKRIWCGMGIKNGQIVWNRVDTKWG